MISYKNKFIFIHIPKNGGTSINKMLRPFVEGNDPETYLLEGYSQQKQIHYQHITMPQIHEHYPQIDTKEYFKFCFIRNPWDRAVSDWLWMKADRGLPNATLKDYLRESNGFEKFTHTHNYDGRGDHFIPQTNFFLDENGNELVDFVGRFENLSRECCTILECLNLPPTMLPHINATKRKHYSEYYTNETRMLVANKYAADIEYGKYKF